MRVPLIGGWPFNKIRFQYVSISGFEPLVGQMVGVGVDGELHPARTNPMSVISSIFLVIRPKPIIPQLARY